MDLSFCSKSSICATNQLVIQVGAITLVWLALNAKFLGF